jgi:uncharacterized protein (DUF302 family)
MSDPLRTIVYGPAAPGGDPRLRVSALPFPETLERLREALRAEDLWLIQEVDPQALARRGGFAIHPARQLFFFHPRYLVRILEGDPGALEAAPLKLVVMASPEGTVTVRSPDVAAAFAAHPALEGLAAELAALCLRLAASVGT